MSNILIIGAGYIGTELFKRTVLKQGEHSLTILPRARLDYTDERLAYKYIAVNEYDYIINCTGFTGKPNVDEAESKKELCWNLNVRVPLMLSHICKKLDRNIIHISSGCVYDGYAKEYTEEDVPNFGLFDHSSFYSKSKHAFESLNDYGCLLRIRMPFSNTEHKRNYLSKILGYNNIVNYVNSKTYIPDLCHFIQYLIDNEIRANSIGTLNFVNPGARDTASIIEQMKAHDLTNPKWEFVTLDSLKLAAPRSNCVLSMQKFEKLFPDFELIAEQQAVDLALYNIKNQ